jgi:capsular polysaccharide transport system permease protein
VTLLTPNPISEVVMDGSAPLRETAAPARDTLRPDRGPRVLPARWPTWLRNARGFLLVVVLPTLATALYYFAIAASQYESEAHFVVKTSLPSQATGGASLAEMFGLQGAVAASRADSLSVGDYLSSHDAVATLERRLDLIRLFSRPEADILARIHPASPSAERLLKYYRRQVKVSYDPDTGITTLRVRAFRPGDAYQMTETLLALGEQRVNILNQRALANGVAVAEQQLKAAERGVAEAQVRVTRHRQDARDLDADRSSVVQIELLGQLQQQLAMSRAQLTAMSGSVAANSPQRVALTERVAALAAQVAAQRGRLAGPPGSMAAELGPYQDLQLQREFAAKRYEAAAAALESARHEAMKQQLYLVRVVEPNRPEAALYPRRWLMLASVFFAALLTYGVGWLIVAGVKEHAA